MQEHIGENIMPSTESQEKFIRVLSHRDSLALAFGAMVGWGWVALSGGWVHSAGAAGAVSAFIVGGAIMTLIGLVYAELASAMPFVGGEHVYSHRALGETGAFVCTWAITLAYVAVSAFEAVALPTVLEELVPAKGIKLWSVADYDVHLTWAMIGVTASILVTWINAIGIKAAAFIQVVVTLGLLLAGLLFISGATLNGNITNIQPLFKDNLGGVMAVLVVVPFMFVGFDVIPQMAEEINLPGRQIGKLIVTAVLLAVAWYSLICVGVALSVPPDELAHTRLAPVTGTATTWHTPFAGNVIVIAGIAGILTSWNAFFVGGARAIYVMATAGQLPSWLARLSPKYRTPINAIVLMGGLCCIAPFFGHQMLVWLVNAGSFSVVIAYGLVALSFLVLRWREPRMDRPYKVKAGRFVGVAALVASIGLGALYLPGSRSALVWPFEWAIIAAWVMLGLLLYFYRRVQIMKSPVTLPVDSRG